MERKKSWYSSPLGQNATRARDRPRAQTVIRHVYYYYPASQLELLLLYSIYNSILTERYSLAIAVDMGPEKADDMKKKAFPNHDHYKLGYKNQGTGDPRTMVTVELSHMYLIIFAMISAGASRFGCPYPRSPCAPGLAHGRLPAPTGRPRLSVRLLVCKPVVARQSPAKVRIRTWSRERVMGNLLKHRIIRERKLLGEKLTSGGRLREKKKSRYMWSKTVHPARSRTRNVPTVYLPRREISTIHILEDFHFPPSSKRNEDDPPLTHPAR